MHHHTRPLRRAGALALVALTALLPTSSALLAPPLDTTPLQAPASPEEAQPAVVRVRMMQAGADASENLTLQLAATALLHGDAAAGADGWTIVEAPPSAGSDWSYTVVLPPDAAGASVTTARVTMSVVKAEPALEE